MTHRLLMLSLVAFTCGVSPAVAQNWSFDARKVGQGSPGSGENIASKMIDEQRDYRSIVLPFGLLQVLSDFDKLNPTHDDFDLVRTFEYAASPLHYTFGRNTSARGDDLVVDIANREVSRDLNDYKGFVPVNQPPAEGLASPNWGKTFKLRARDDGGFQGIYVGAGPYLSFRTEAGIDERLIRILGASERVYVPTAALPVQNTTRGQMALSVTGGYRGRFAWPGGGGSQRDGLYVAANYNHLRGFRYEDVDIALRLDTDVAGLVTVNPFLPPPLVITRSEATSGTGFAIDVGVGGVMNGWEFGLGANGIGNRIEWEDTVVRTYSHTNLLGGNADLLESVPFFAGDVRIELPVDYRAHLGYTAERWSGAAEFGHGFQGDSFRVGGEYRLGVIDVRGGAGYSRELWSPTGGIGVNVTPGFAIDAAVYANSANVERVRHPAVAFSLRLTR